MIQIPQLPIPHPLLDTVALHDTLNVRPDTLGAPPLPGGISVLVRAVFAAPTWLWAMIIVVAAAIAGLAAWQAWLHRVALVTWLRTRPRGVTIGIFTTVGFLVLASAGFGAASWHFMQHDNRFCVSCHVMTPAFQAMKTSTVHDTLQCHQCHQQSLFASAFQLYVWLKDRPDKIEKHAIVPSSTCKGCHNAQTDQKWTRVLRTAGHRLHLESDTSALANIQCTTCHGQEIHRFLPADHTCGQSGCHRSEDTHIRIGPMAAQTSLHCITCHQFTAELPQLASLDSARGTLRPGRNQCFSCHAMQVRLAEFNLAKDPHRGQCGDCHNPHTQTHPIEAIKNCTSAGCHVEWRDIPFHAGANHRSLAVQPGECITCHNPHAARLDASDCQGCHAAVAQKYPRFRNIPQRFDTTRALRGAEKVTAPKAMSFEKEAVPKKPPRTMAPDSFEHARHRALACLTCHPVQGSARLSFEAPRGCSICHHQSPDENRCDNCHQPAQLAAPRSETVTVAVRDHAPVPRAVGFRHETHQRLRCVNCHTTSVTLAPADSVRSCSACHDDHHQAGRSCGTCHNVTATFAVHAPPANAHQGCDACHATQTIARLVPDRAMCLTCHAAQASHQPGRECSTCHFLADPADYRRHLTIRSS